jgi:hypothetical protein
VPGASDRQSTSPLIGGKFSYSLSARRLADVLSWNRSPAATSSSTDLPTPTDVSRLNS